MNVVKIKIITFGCALNQADSEQMKFILKKHNYEIVEENEDVLIVNTCGVKHATENKIISLLKKEKQKGKKIVVAGCLFPIRERIYKETGASVFLSPYSVGKVVEAVEAALKDRVLAIDEESKPHNYEFGKIVETIAIQEGCLNFCSYCFTKFARKRLYSLDEKRVCLLINEAIRKGAKEIRLTGTDLSAYGREKKKTILDLLKLIPPFQDVRIRLGMFNPAHLPDIIEEMKKELLRNPFYRFLHIPVQSGSNKVLELMKRGYTIEEAERIFSVVRNEFTLATDIIVGFPGEEDEDFEDTVKLLEKWKFDVVNVSMFSSRPFTEASKMKKISTDTIKKRSKYLTELRKEIALKQNEKFIGKEVEVLILEKRKEHMWGRSREYKSVYLDKGEMGKIVNAVIEEVTHAKLIGKKI